MGWEVITPFLRPIEPFLMDPDVSDILVNARGRVFIEKEGQLRTIAGVTLGEKSLQVAVRNIARTLNQEISEEKPLLDARLPDGSRVAAVFPPCSVGGTTLAIRKFQNKRYSAEELVRVGMLSARALEQLQGAVEDRQNVLISGGTGTGKTTLLNALAASIPEDERVIVIEDTSEVQIDKPNLVRLEARKGQENLPAVTIRDLLKATLRLRPDRILLGEVRSDEAFDLLQALNTGHCGSLSTIHAISASKSLARFTTLAMMAGMELPHRVIRREVADGLNILVHLSRRHGRRVVTEILTVKSYDAERDQFELETLWSGSATTPEKVES